MWFILVFGHRFFSKNCGCHYSFMNIDYNYNTSINTMQLLKDSQCCFVYHELHDTYIIKDNIGIQNDIQF